MVHDFCVYLPPPVRSLAVNNSSLADYTLALFFFFFFFFVPFDYVDQCALSCSRMYMLKDGIDACLAIGLFFNVVSIVRCATTLFVPSLFDLPPPITPTYLPKLISRSTASSHRRYKLRIINGLIISLCILPLLI